MNIAVYLIKASVSIILFYLVYRLLFKRFTFFVLNRIYLLFAMLGSFVLPFISLPERPLQSGMIDYSMGFDWEQVGNITNVAQSAGADEHGIHFLVIVVLIYSLISFVRLFRGIRQFYLLRKSYSDGTILSEKGYRLNVHAEVHSPFTMFRTVYLDPDTYAQVNSPVLRHEIVHARQLHSIDLLLSEIICAFLWFNPFVFLLKRQIRDNHEFLADQVAGDGQENLINYMQALSRELTRKYDPVFASNFRSSTLKKRIIMLTNRKSSNSKKWFYLLLVPLLGVIVMSFQEPMEMVFDEVSMQAKVDGYSIAMPWYGSEKPSRFPLDEKFRDQVTFEYNKRAKNPITGEMMTHKGIDFRAPKGSPVYAAGGGVVLKSAQDEAYGKIIIIQHDEGFTSLYAHLNALLVKKGEEVAIGQKIGEVGNTGRSTGDHLHFEVRKDGENVDPAEYY